MTGVTFGQWIKVLKENRFDVEFPYWGRAAVTTLLSLQNSTMRQIENGIHQRRILKTEIPAPLFVLGMFRSGTTYLHYLLAQDQRFAYPNYYQVMFPHSFLCTEKFIASVLDRLVPKTRPQDQLQFGLSFPNEDEMALCNLTGRSNNMDLVFGRNSKLNRKYYTLHELSETEVEQWKTALKWFVQKLTYKYRRPLVMKSPAHTGRISTLLKLFPEARFVHIRRNPYDVFRSWKSMAGRVAPWWQFQRINFDDIEEGILSVYAMIYDAFLDERTLIPERNLYELNYEDLIENPVGQMQNIYHALNLPAFEEFKPDLTAYLKSMPEHKPSNYPELSQSIRDRISQQWQRYFDAWGYSTR